jgi:hypothetical protein
MWHTLTTLLDDAAHFKVRIAYAHSSSILSSCGGVFTDGRNHLFAWPTPARALPFVRRRGGRPTVMLTWVSARLSSEPYWYALRKLFSVTASLSPSLPSPTPLSLSLFVGLR